MKNLSLLFVGPAAGVFHSDPHPGNVVVMANGEVGLLDFGEVKELDDETRLHYAKLTVALAHRNQELSIRFAEEAGLHITGCPEEFKYAAVHVLFDTNMDMDVRFVSSLDVSRPHVLRITVFACRLRDDCAATLNTEVAP